MFDVDITFRGNCLLRYLADGKNLDQRFFQRSELLSLESVSNDLKLWVSNAGALKAQIEDREIVLGRQGQVVTKLIRWVEEDESGLYQLEIIPVF